MSYNLNTQVSNNLSSQVSNKIIPQVSNNLCVLMRALIISDEDLDCCNLHNPLAEVMDLSEEDWD